VLGFEKGKKMKKMMMMMAIVLCVGIAQASSISWSVNALKQANLDNTLSVSILSGAIVYGFVGTATDAANALTAASGDTFGTWLAGFSGTQIGTSLTSTTGAASKTNQGSFAGSSSQSVFLVIFDAATYDAANNVMVTSVFTQTLPASGSKMYAFGTQGGSYIASTWTDIVPEPTSMALLGLGAAVLGLRRKFRK
jgi:hypothetical protein